MLDIATDAGIGFRRNALDLTGRAAELGQEILPAMAKFVFDIDTDNGMLSLPIRKMKGRRGARSTWAGVPFDANDPERATPAAHATGWGSPYGKKTGEQSPDQ